MRTNPKLLLIAAAAVGLSVSNANAGSTRDWDGDGLTSNWGNFNNWYGLQSPGAADDARFGDSSVTGLQTTSTVDTSRSVNNFFVVGPAAQGDYVFKGSNTTLTVTNQFALQQPQPVKDNATISSGLTVDAHAVIVDKDSHLTISGGGSVIAHAFSLQNSGTGPSPTLVIGSGGTFRFATAGDTAGITSGTLELDSGGAFSIDSGAGVSVQSSTAVLALNTNWAVPAGTTVSAVSGGRIISNSYLDVASGSAGTFSVDGSGTSATIGTAAAAYTDWATPGGSATVYFSNSATGSYSNGLHVASAGGTANVNILSGAQLSVSNGLTVGGGATSVANVALNNATLAIPSGSYANFGNGSTFNFQSGTVSLAGDATFSTGSTLNWSGGLFTGTGVTLGIDGGVANVTRGGIGINNQTLSITNGGHFDSTSYIDVGTFTNGTELVSGAGSRITSATLYSDWGLNPGSAATVTFSSSGVGTYSTGVHLAGNGGAAALNINSGGVLNVAQQFRTGGSAAGTAAAITINGGTLNSSGSTNFLAGTTVNASNFSGLNFGDNATFSTGSSVNLNKTTVTLPSGKTLTVDGGVVTDVANTILGSGQTLQIQNNGHWDALQENLAGGTVTVTGSGSHYITSGGDTWKGPGLNVNFTNGGIGSFGGSVNLGGGTFINSLNVATLSTATFAGLTTNANTTVSGITGATTITLNGGTLATTAASQFNNGAVVNLTAGSLNFGGNSTFSTGSALNWSGSAKLNLASGTTLAINGGTATFTNVSPQYQNNSTLSVGAGGLLQSNASLLIASGASGSSGSVVVDGTNARLISNPTFGQSVVGGGVGTNALLRISNGGAATFTASVSGGITAAAGGGIIQIGPNGGTLTADALTLGSTSSASSMLNVINGTANISGNMTMSGTALASYQSGSLNIGGALTTSNSSAITTSSGTVLRTHGVTINDTSFINLSGLLIDDYASGSPVSTIRGYLITGRNGGLWNGVGLSSSTAHLNSNNDTGLGYAEASQILGSGGGVFQGQSVDGTTVLVKYTYNGDADLNGKINANDYGLIDSGYQNQKNAGFVYDWYDGDFDYSGKIDANDYALIDAAYQLQSGTLRDAIDYLETGAVPGGTISESLQEVIDHENQFGASYANDFIFANVPEPTIAGNLTALLVSGILIGSRPRLAAPTI